MRGANEGDAESTEIGGWIGFCIRGTSRWPLFSGSASSGKARWCMENID